MSQWTHIIAAIEYDTLKMSDNLVKDMMNELNKAPRITGSEEDAQIFINQPSGYNMSVGCGGRKGVEKYQTKVVITVVGHLRNRDKKRTTREWADFLGYVNDMPGIVRNVCYKIEED